MRHSEYSKIASQNFLVQVGDLSDLKWGDFLDAI
jgi:hypothetical protein